ncbi:MAG: Thiol:disulfide interchange protein CycY [Hyphomicrobiaceae bacterium hypho_1]
MLPHKGTPSKIKVCSFRNFAKLILPLVIFLSLTIFFGYSLKNTNHTKLPSVLIGRPIPDYDFLPMDGLNRDGAPVRGFVQSNRNHDAPMVINFFASWCAPCIQEHSVLKKLKKQTGIRMIGINYKDRPDDGLHFLTRFGNPFDEVGRDDNGRGSLEWGVYGIPETFIVNKQGRIIYRHVGPIDKIQLQNKIVPMINELLR